MSTETTYRVTGMTCGGCARSIERALDRAVPGVAVTVSHEDDAVTLNGAHDAAAVKAAIEAAGFVFEG